MNFQMKERKELRRQRKPLPTLIEGKKATLDRVPKNFFTSRQNRPSQRGLTHLLEG